MRIVNTLQDRANLGEKIAGYALWLLILILSATLVGSIGRSKFVNKEIARKKLELQKIENENIEFEKKIVEAQSQEYIEKEIRNKLGLVKPGEVTVVLPDKEVLKKLVSKNEEEIETLPDPNWRKWLRLFM